MKYIPCDIETAGLKFYKHRILGIGYGSTYTPGLHSVPGPCVAHNGKFETKMLRHNGIKFEWAFDTLLAPSILINRPASLTLDSVASYYLQMPAWKDETSALMKKKNWEQIHDASTEVQEKLRVRNILDLKATEDLVPVLLKQLETEGMEAFYFEKLMPAARLLADVEYRGMRIDVDATRQKMVDISQKIVDLKKELDAWAAPAAVNWNSPKQLTALLKQKGYNLWIYDFKKKQQVESTGVDSLERLLPNVAISKLLEYRQTTKLLGYLEGWLEEHNNGYLHPSYNVASTRTGRLSCIEENQLIEMPGGPIPIKEVQPGQMVYCYDEHNKLTLRKVLKVIDNGMQQCIKLKWQSIGKMDSGELICTEDHKIKTRYRGWKAAGSLKRYDRVVHLRKRLQANGRHRLYGPDKYMELEEQCIKREYFKASSSMHIHHLNHNKADNTLENLEILSQQKHASLHGRERATEGKIAWKHLLTGPRRYLYGKDRPNFITISRFQLLRRIAATRGRLTYVKMDFDTLKKKCKEAKLDLKAIIQRYGEQGQYINAASILRAIELHRTMQNTARSLGIGTAKLKHFCAHWGISYNHMISSKQEVGLRHVYDLEVEGHHNFIASELCVHNCSQPNLQNVPRDKTIRKLFIPSEGKKFVIADYAQIEPRIAAHYSGDEALLKVFKENLDFYGSIACKVLGVKCHPNEVKEKFPKERKVAKEIGLSILYGIGAGKLSSIIKKRTGIVFSKDDCTEIISDYFAAHPDLLRFRRELETRVLKGEILKTHYGRQFQIDHDKIFSTAVNTMVQSTASDACLFSQLEVERRLKLVGIEAPLIALVHDEIIRECAPEHVDIVGKIMEEVMTNQGFNCPLKLDWAPGNNWGDKV